MPLPAMVVIFRSRPIFLILLFPKSEMYTLPVASTVTPFGELRLAAVAGPPSPKNPNVPSPAIVVMTLVDALTFLIR